MCLKKVDIYFMYNDIKDLYRSKGHKFFEKKWSINVFGIRDLELSQQDSKLNEKLGVCFIDDSGCPISLFFDACTIPAIKYLESPVNPSGCAILKEGQYRGSHQIGKHKGRNALIQTGAPVDVWRDKNLDGVIDIGGKMQSGYFGINIHDGKSRNWSAGCQIIAKEDMAVLFAIAQKSAERYGNSFTYTLF